MSEELISPSLPKSCFLFLKYGFFQAKLTVFSICFLLEELPSFFLSFFFWSAAYGILVPRPGVEPTHPALQVWSLNHWTAREVQAQFL